MVGFSEVKLASMLCLLLPPTDHVLSLHLLNTAKLQNPGAERKRAEYKALFIQRKQICTHKCICFYYHNIHLYGNVFQLQMSKKKDY